NREVRRGLEEHYASTSTVPSRTTSENDEALPDISVAFYRKHTEKMLRRYLYASMLVGRAPSILGEPVGRGWVSSRRVKTFEDAVIFVLDVERCLDRLGTADRALLSRIALQEYTYPEAASLLGISARAISYKYPLALDRLTELLLGAKLLILSS
ncbi:MAG TPA: sigma factor-like helix-turn-helix DNA-binding protein, partial [Terracidiphilus sp.]|nr:sigma factor-like helix-turn-helix DNA-binding protein [Terracidiphilus sp.]